MQPYSNIKRVKVLGVGIDDVTMEKGLEIVDGWLCHCEEEQSDDAAIFQRRKKIASHPLAMTRSIRNDTPKLIFTPGPEFLVTAQNDPEFKKILNSADLNLPDGYGLKIFGGITHVVPGVEFMLALCKLAAGKGYTIGLLGGQTGVASLTAEKLKEKFSEVKISFAIDGKEADRLIDDYDALRYVDILFVALGHPKQEKFLSVIARSQSDAAIFQRKKIASHSLAMTEAVIPAKAGIYFKVGMGVGGSFDEISGTRVPPILQQIGLKWLWRLIREPKRFKRIFRATIFFPLMVFKKNLLL